MRILHVVGARPNFVKIAPVMGAFARLGGVEQLLVHTGQHYDDELSDAFFSDLELPRPDVNLTIGSGTHAVQTGRIMMAFEPVLRRVEPDWVFTVGDVNSTLAAALVTTKLGISVAHVEAGLRSGDWSMPEEVNRVLTDRMSDALFTTEPAANENLRLEGIDVERVHYVGNVMIDALDSYRQRAAELAVNRELELEPGRYVVVTLHRPRNVDEPERLRRLIRALNELVYEYEREVVWPIHPRSAKRVREFDLEGELDTLRMLKPLSYLEFLSLMDQAALVVTDSGGIQEETSVLGVPCVTVRPNTERPITLSEGTNRLFDGDLDALADLCWEAMQTPRRPCRPELWDGKAADRIARITVNAPPRAVLRAGAGGLIGAPHP